MLLGVGENARLGHLCTIAFMEDQVKQARIDMLAARQTAEECAAAYRKTVSEAVEYWRANGVSLRECARRIGITEGALRDLLRPGGSSRSARRKKAQPTNKGTITNE